MKRFVAFVLLFGIECTASFAQTANSSPTMPAPPGLPGTPPAVSRSAATSGTGKPLTANQLDELNADENLPGPSQAEERKIDRMTTICRQCD